MTPEEKQLTIAAFAALGEQKPVEFQTRDGEWEPTGWHFPHRPKPKPALPRPWSKPSDVPGPVCYMASNDLPEQWTIVESASPSGIRFWGSWKTWKELATYRHSTDRLTWKPCTTDAP